MSVSSLSDELKSGLVLDQKAQFVSFGWGDENFYLNTPTWSDLTVSNACKAMFWESSTLMHVTWFTSRSEKWREVKVSKQQLNRIVTYLQKSFQLDKSSKKQYLLGAGYSNTDSFYKANGSYSCLKTCNTWVNDGFAQADLKACLWTPFDFGLLKKYGSSVYYNYFHVHRLARVRSHMA